MTPGTTDKRFGILLFIGSIGTFLAFGLLLALAAWGAAEAGRAFESHRRVRASEFAAANFPRLYNLHFPDYEGAARANAGMFASPSAHAEYMAGLRTIARTEGASQASSVQAALTLILHNVSGPVGLAEGDRENGYEVAFAVRRQSVTAEAARQGCLLVHARVLPATGGTFVYDGAPHAVTVDGPC